MAATASVRGTRLVMAQPAGRHRAVGPTRHRRTWRGDDPAAGLVELARELARVSTQLERLAASAAASRPRSHRAAPARHLPTSLAASALVAAVVVLVTLGMLAWSFL